MLYGFAYFHLVFVKSLWKKQKNKQIEDDCFLVPAQRLHNFYFFILRNKK